MPQFLFEGQEPYEPSGFLIDDVESTEITLCHDPAVKEARFRIIRSTGSDSNRVETIGMNFQSGAKTNKYKQQVIGYVSTPWMEDWYGDVMDIDSIERAAHSFLKNLANQNVQGNGVGEEHARFWHNAHVIESFVDRDGQVGGIPGGWWMSIQITDPDTWNKILNSEYTGFSLGSQVRFTYTKNLKFIQSVLDNIPTMIAKVAPTEPKEGKRGLFKNPGEFGYPTERSAYADPNNNKFPIDTRSRAYAVLRHITQHWEEEGYSAGELKYMVQRMVAAIVREGDEVPAKILQRIGFDNTQSITDFAVAQGISSKQPNSQNAQSVYPTNTAVSSNSMHKGETPMDLESLLAQFNEQSQRQNALLQEIVTKLNSVPAPVKDNTQSAPVAPATDPAPAQPAPAQDNSQPAPAPAQPAPAQDNTQSAPASAPATAPAPAQDNTQSAPVSAIQELVQAAVTEILQKNQAVAPAAAPASAPATSQKSITPEDLQAAFTQFGTALLQGLAANQQTTNTAIEGLATRITEMPVPRATMNRTMSKDQRTTFLETIKRKIEDGSDISGEDYALAQSFGVNFDRDDPMAGVAF